MDKKEMEKLQMIEENKDLEKLFSSNPPSPYSRPEQVYNF